MYLKHWKLKQRPFTTAFVSDLVYFSRPLADAYHSLMLSTKLYPGISWLIGPKSCGKTTLLRCLGEGLGQELVFSLVAGEYVHERNQISRIIFAGGDDSGMETQSLEFLLREYFLDSQHSQIPFAIAIDNAEKIDDEEIILELIDLQIRSSSNGWPLSVILSGGHIPTALTPTPLRPAEVINLRAPDSEEARKIIENRLRVSGSRKRIFSRPALEAIVAESDGDIARLLTICDLCLQIGFENGRSTIDQKFVLDHVLPVVTRFVDAAKTREAARAWNAVEQEAILIGGGDFDGRAGAPGAGKKSAKRPQSGPRRLHVIPKPGITKPDKKTGRETESTDDREDSGTEDAADRERAPDDMSASEETPTSAYDALEVEPRQEEPAEGSDNAEPDRLRTYGKPEVPRHLFSPSNIKAYAHGTGEVAYGVGRGAEGIQGLKSGDFAYSNMSVPILYESGVRLMGDILSRLRKLEFVDLDPVRKFSRAIIKSTAINDGVLQFAIGEKGKYDLATHLVNVATLAAACGRKLELEKIELTELADIALMHDVGHLHSNEELLLSENRFDRRDFKTVKQHPIVGHDLILQHTNGSQLMAEVILQEHERNDGLGYPNYLSGHEIHFFAKIIAVCDIFEALTHSRAHRPTLTPEDALVEISTTMLRRTDPRVINALKAAVRQALRSH